MKGTGALTVVALSLYDPKSLPPSLFPFVQLYIRWNSLADDRLFPCISSRQLPELHESVRHAESPQCTRHDAKARLEAQPGRSVSRPPSPLRSLRLPALSRALWLFVSLPFTFYIIRPFNEDDVDACGHSCMLISPLPTRHKNFRPTAPLLPLPFFSLLFSPHDVYSPSRTRPGADRVSSASSLRSPLEFSRA